MSQITGKRAATSPLSSGFDKKPKLGLTAEKYKKFNSTQSYISHPTWIKSEEVKVAVLALASREVESLMSNTLVDVEYCEQRIKQLSPQEQLELASTWIEARDTNDWTKFADHLLHQMEVSESSRNQEMVEDLSPHLSYEQSYKATVESWDIAYIGDAHDQLYQHITHYSKQAEYARYTSIVQSSGMGKSRAVDELAKKHLVIPLNLRKDSDGGFPPPDTNVRNWLLKSTTKKLAFTRSLAFLTSLFVTLLDFMKHTDADANATSGSRAAKFRHLMTSGQTFAQQGPIRIKFYEDVLELANKTCESSPSTLPSSALPATQDPHDVDAYQRLREAVSKLMEHLIPAFNVLNTYPPALIISFDEAHPLAKIEDHSWSKFSELRRALQLVHSYPCFFVFLSTTGKISQFMPQTINGEYVDSNRVQRALPKLVPPFCELGFDQLAKKAKTGMTLDTVASLEFMATLSRPLFSGRYIKGDDDVKKSVITFAGEKLLCKQYPISVRDLNHIEKLACISVRIPLEFSARSLHEYDVERILVEKHLRVCLKVDPRFQTAITIAPSEPLLAEASYLLMKDPEFDLPRCLLSELELSRLSKGDRGELVAMALCLMARDTAVASLDSPIIPVLDFIQKLLNHSADVLRSKPVRARNPEEADRTFEETFSKSNMFFNHFIKFRAHRVINREYLLRLIARGAAGICADFQYGTDIVIPFLFWNRVLRRENVSAIILQIKNNQGFQAIPCEWIYDMMNPYHIGFFDREEEPIPIIRLVFSLASTTSTVVVLQPPERAQPPREANSKAGLRADEYTSFDIWCAKASRHTFLPIKDDMVFHEILLRSRFFPDIYERKESIGLQNVTRSMNPGTDTHPAHWTFFDSMPTVT